MRCIIRYTWSETSASGGTTDFGVTDEQDPRIAEERAALERRGMYIQSVRFW